MVIHPFLTTVAVSNGGGIGVLGRQVCVAARLLPRPYTVPVWLTRIQGRGGGKRRRKEEEDRESIDPRCIPTKTRWSTGTDMYADNVGGAGIVICSTYLAQIGMELYLMIKCKQQRSFRVKTLPRYV